VPPDSISRQLESYNAPLEHPIHMPSLSALSYPLYYYESPMQNFYETYNKE